MKELLCYYIGVKQGRDFEQEVIQLKQAGWIDTLGINERQEMIFCLVSDQKLEIPELSCVASELVRGGAPDEEMLRKHYINHVLVSLITGRFAPAGLIPEGKLDGTARNALENFKTLALFHTDQALHVLNALCDIGLLPGDLPKDPEMAGEMINEAVNHFSQM